MAAFEATAALSTEVALAANTPKTVLMLKAAANHLVQLREYGVSFDGVSPTGEPVMVELVRLSTDGTMTAVTPNPIDPGRTETLQTAAYKPNSAEPTVSAVLEAREIHPQAGFEKGYPWGSEILIPGGGRLGIRVTLPLGATAINCAAFMRFVE